MCRAGMRAIETKSLSKPWRMPRLLLKVMHSKLLVKRFFARGLLAYARIWRKIMFMYLDVIEHSSTQSRKRHEYMVTTGNIWTIDLAWLVEAQ
jgi:hypothetical protein